MKERYVVITVAWGDGEDMSGMRVHAVEFRTKRAAAEADRFLASFKEINSVLLDDSLPD